MADLSKVYSYIDIIFQKISRIFFGALDFLFIKVYLSILIVLNLFIWLSAFMISNKIEGDLMILHYNVDFGVDLFGSVSQIFNIPLLGLIVILLNFLVYIIFHQNKNFRFLGHLLMIASLLVNLILLTSLGPIYLINFM